MLRRSSIESRFEALRRGGTPFVGRAEEFELLLRRWHQVKSGQGRMVVLTGEPGIGKSRIIVALQERLQGDRHITMSAHAARSSIHAANTMITPGAAST